MLPNVSMVRTGFATALVPGEIPQETPVSDGNQALLFAPGERYDVIVDFSNLPDGTVLLLQNTGPDSPFGGFGPDFEPADPATTGKMVQLIVDHSLANPLGDQSTDPFELVLEQAPPIGDPVLTRDLALKEEASSVCVGTPPESDQCAIPIIDCSQGVVDPLTGENSLTYGPVRGLLGYDGSLGVLGLTAQLWMDPIQQTPELGTTEVWELWNWTADAHPIHVHLVAFEILGRYDVNDPTKEIGEVLPHERGRKDTVVSYPDQVTRIKMHFDIAGLFVWHCHILSHEDNEMMLPFCVGTPGLDCAASLF